MQVLWSFQQAGGLIESWHGDGNFARTTIMYCLWKTQGVTAQPWRPDLRLGAVHEGDQLQVMLSSEAPWSGKLIFDRPRHAENLRLPVDWPRINQFPEWFTVQAARTYQVSTADTGRAERRGGAELASGISVSVDANHAVNLTVSPLP
jgi:hypothetical protein